MHINKKICTVVAQLTIANRFIKRLHLSGAIFK